MKKSELKKIIKECVKEVIFEDGTLSGIISEVVQGLGTANLVQEQRRPAVSTEAEAQAQAKLNETRKQMRDAIGANSYEDVKQRFANPEMFEGTKPLAESKGQGGALSGIDPGDAGVDISNIPGFGKWGTVASATRK
tara:strand:+ start:316 stop:726 length:411 start_codon:yes stop_codon:yes gene_type:complete